MEKEIELISFDLCPYVQRSVIMLLYKGVEFKRTNIDLKNKPDWFLKISPFGKVPVLKIGDDILFESAVINEYLDEITEGSLLSNDPLERAKQRAWIVYAGELNMLSKKMAESTSIEVFNELLSETFEKLKRVEEVHSGEKYFSGSEFSLADISYAPFFMRFTLVEDKVDEKLWNEVPKMKKWSKTLRELDCVKNSVPKDFVEISKKRYSENGSVLFT